MSAPTKARIRQRDPNAGAPPPAPPPRRTASDDPRTALEAYGAAALFLRRFLGTAELERLLRISDMDPAEDVYRIAEHLIRSLLRWQGFVDSDSEGEGTGVLWPRLVRDALAG